MYCGKCGAEVIEGKRFCSDCGAMLVDTDSQQSPQAVSQNTECQNQQYQPDNTNQPTANPFPYGTVQQQSIPYTQAVATRTRESTTTPLTTTAVFLPFT